MNCFKYARSTKHFEKRYGRSALQSKNLDFMLLSYNLHNVIY